MCLHRRVARPANVGFGALSLHVTDSTVRLHHLLRGAARIDVDRHTLVDGLARRGQPYIGEGQLVHVDARFCKVPGSIGTKIVARRIAPAGPIVPPSTAEDVLGVDWRRSRADAIVAPHGYGWQAGVALVLTAAVGALLLARRRSPRSGTGWHRTD